MAKFLVLDGEIAAANWDEQIGIPAGGSIVEGPDAAATENLYVDGDRILSKPEKQNSSDRWDKEKKAYVAIEPVAAQSTNLLRRGEFLEALIFTPPYNSTIEAAKNNAELIVELGSLRSLLISSRETISDRVYLRLLQDCLVKVGTATGWSKEEKGLVNEALKILEVDWKV